jgi:vitamin B12/bleomycin/antimicrobial peptide transport system ATP-binding/permease protein
VEIPRALVFLAYIYVIIATVFAIRIGRPLIRLNFLNELLTASYRYALVRVRDNSENIAFYHGEQVENAGLMARFNAVIANTWAIVFRSLKFQGFNFVVSQIAVVFPYIIQARRFFAQEITLGDVTQTANAFSQVQGALSFFRLAYDDFASYRAVLDRLTGLLDANEEARAMPTPSTESQSEGLNIQQLQIRLPDGRPLLSNLNLSLRDGDSLLVKGPSGSGKTTLLAASPDCGRTSKVRSLGRPTPKHCFALSSPTCRWAPYAPRWPTLLRRGCLATMAPGKCCRRLQCRTWPINSTRRAIGP